MGVAKLKKVELYYHKTIKDDVAKLLQQSGSCQIIEEAVPELQQAKTGPSLELCEHQQGNIRYLFRSLGSYFKDPVSSMARTLGEKPELTMDELAKLAKDTDLDELVSFTKEFEQELNQLHIEESQLHSTEELLTNISWFPYQLEVLTSGTKTLKGVMGSVPDSQLAAFKNALADMQEDTELYTSDPSKQGKDTYFALLFARDREDDVLERCLKNGASLLEPPAGVKGTAAEELNRTQARLANYAKSEEQQVERLTKTATEWMPTVQKLSDYWDSAKVQCDALLSSGTTESTLRTSFWVPADALPALQKKIEGISKVTAFVASDPTEEDTPPTLLENSALVRPFEILTDLYSPPTYSETDPTGLMAPFFVLFFGMCLGDAGYGIVMLACLWFILKKYRRIPTTVKGFISIFVMGSVATIIYGVVSGSFFGDFIDAFGFMKPFVGIKNSLMLVDPMKDPMKVLGISLVLGLIHLMFGLAIAARDCIRKHDYVDAVGDKISWILFIVGLALILTCSLGMVPAWLLLPAKIMAAAGALIIFWYAGREKKNIFAKVTSGLLALYGSTSYLGDVLSYSRLLALGFGSAVIGMIVNLLGGMAAGIPYAGWLLAIVIVLGGHIFSIAINLLGAFVHPLRLQYVEFFGKFYGGGGSLFNPMRLSTKYVDVKEIK